MDNSQLVFCKVEDIVGEEVEEEVVEETKVEVEDCEYCCGIGFIEVDDIEYDCEYCDLYNDSHDDSDPDYEPEEEEEFSEESYESDESDCGAACNKKVCFCGSV